MKEITYKKIVSSEAELREMLGEPSALAANKVIDHLDVHCREYLAKSPFVTISTADASGACDVSPRGDAPGFVLVLDDKHLVLPERPGNKRVDSIRNILSNPQIGLLFLIPGLEETLRINGRACVIRDEQILEQMAVNGRVPQLGIAVEVEECFIHCAKALKRSGLWKPDTWLPAEERPNPAKILVDHAKLPGKTVDDVADMLKESYTKRLY